MYDDIANSLHGGILIQDEDCRFCDASIKSRRLAGQADASLVVKSSSADFADFAVVPAGHFRSECSRRNSLEEVQLFLLAKI